ncbi:GNAT family N-acetyltransferase [Paenibacillus tundrae]|uniref:Ribosomal-protein-alanine N-acetyltransferase n=1 Tax=Paenibacillus tundrae TaxID=528187 RepID=A0ABT9WHL4_9BACL|nr:GNAT family N-acetyltransferase [Paenibacillus tundrae]MDQ0172696.1 ribosomal-protein-alanine N-acetyltransferase [Paenibacillus tundrae]
MITELHTERLQLRKMKDSDSPSLFNIWSDPDVTKFMNISPFTDEAQAVAMIHLLDDLSRDKKAIRFSIIEKNSNQIIGSCGFNSLDYDHYRAEIGYDLAQSHWGRGFASESIRAMLEHGYSILKMNRIEAKVDPDNVNSIKLLEKLGFICEGTLRQYERVEGAFKDIHMYSKLSSD